MTSSLGKMPHLHSVYSSFTQCCKVPDIAYQIGDMLPLADLLSLEQSSYGMSRIFNSFIRPNDKFRHQILSKREKPSIIFHNLFSKEARFENTVITLITLFAKDKPVNEDQVVNKDALRLVKNLFAIANSTNWDLSRYPDILAIPEALEILAKKDFRKLMTENSNSQEVYFAILPHYIHAWENGADNNITTFLGPSLLHNEAIGRSLVSLEAHFLFYLDPSLQNNKKLVLLACRTGVALGIPELFFDEERFFSLLHLKWREDIDVMKVVCAVYPDALSLAHADLQSNEELLAVMPEHPEGL